MLDFNLSEGAPFLDSDLDQIYQQVDVVFDTTPRDIMGDLDFGTDYEYQLYDLKMSASKLKEIILEDLSEVSTPGYSKSCEVYLLQGTERDIALINIKMIEDENRAYSKSYKIT